MTITTEAAGNVFVSGHAPAVEIRDAHGDITFDLVDYFGRRVTTGTATASGGVAAIALPRLKPGWYELRCQDADSSAATTLGVVIDRGDEPLPADSRVCADAASAWLLRSEAGRAPFARMLRLAGIAWVRERLSWGQTEPEPGRFDWGKYQTTADSLAAEGVHVYQIWHDSPGWTRPGKSNTLCPDDLRTVYRFARAAASQFKRQIQAWEVWNEPDIGFWPDLSDRFAGLQKAAYWGLKDGNPNALVLQGSLCRGVSQFERNFFDSGAADYFDIFNWHIYARPASYAGVLSGHREVLEQHGIAERAAWLTEAGIGLQVPGGPEKRILGEEEQRRQCRFITQSAVMSLAAGDQRNFYFVLPDYMEGTTQFGALHPDLTPYPSFVALSAAANLIGRSEYLGEYKPEVGKGNAHVFATARGTVAIAWADERSRMAFPTEMQAVSVANIFGNERKALARDGSVRVMVGPEAVYVIGLGDRMKGALGGTPRAVPKTPVNHPSRIVLAGHTDLPVVKDEDRYILGYDSATQPFRFTVDAYNFDESNAVAGHIEVSVPEGWSVDGARREIRLEPMGRETVAFEVTPGSSATAGLRVVARGQFGTEPVAPSVSAFMAVESKPLAWAEASRWRPEASPNGSVTVTADDSRHLLFEARFSGEGDRWAYPVLQFDPPVDLSGCDGVVMDFEPLEADLSGLHLLMVEPNGAHYLIGATMLGGDERQVAFLFDDAELLGFIAPDPDGRLDLDRIAAVKLGCNTPRDVFSFKAGRFRLVKFRR
jgi:hypothetical protein